MLEPVTVSVRPSPLPSVFQLAETGTCTTLRMMIVRTNRPAMIKAISEGFNFLSFFRLMALSSMRKMERVNACGIVWAI